MWTSGAMFGVTTWSLAAGATAAGVTTEHGLSQQALEIARPFGIPVTSSMLVTWIVAVGLIVVAQLATRHMKQVPDRLQNFVEWLIESLYHFLEGIIGSHLVKRTFWFFASVFIFILAANWAGLIPGVGSIGWGEQTADGFQIHEPFFRGSQRRREPDPRDGAGLLRRCWIIWGLQSPARSDS